MTPSTSVVPRSMSFTSGPIAGLPPARLRPAGHDAVLVGLRDPGCEVRRDEQCRVAVDRRAGRCPSFVEPLARERDLAPPCRSPRGRSEPDARCRTSQYPRRSSSRWRGRGSSRWRRSAACSRSRRDDLATGHLRDQPRARAGRRSCPRAATSAPGRAPSTSIRSQRPRTPRRSGAAGPDAGVARRPSARSMPGTACRARGPARRRRAPVVTLMRSLLRAGYLHKEY